MKLQGIVQRGAGRGKKLGFPTANVPLNTEIEDGIYLGEVDDKPSLVFIGAAETFNENNRKLEIYILDFKEDIYGKNIEVEIIKKIRDNQKFNSEEELIAQMKQDEKLARHYFKL